MVLCAGTVCRVLCSLCSILSAVCRVLSAGCRVLSAVCCVQGPCVGCCVLCVGCCVLWVCSAGGRAQLFSLGKGVGARARPAGGFLTPVLSARTYHRSTHRRHLLIQKTPPPSSGKCGGAPLTIARAGEPQPLGSPNKGTHAVSFAARRSQKKGWKHNCYLQSRNRHTEEAVSSGRPPGPPWMACLLLERPLQGRRVDKRETELSQCYLYDFSVNLQLLFKMFIF